MKAAGPCGWPARPPACPRQRGAHSDEQPFGEWLISRDSAGSIRRQPFLSGADTYTLAVAGISRTPAPSMMPCPAATAIANLSSMNTGPAVGQRAGHPSSLLRNTPVFSRELQATAGELNNPVSPPWRGLAVRLTRRPGQRGQHHAPTGSFLGRLDKEFPQRDIDVDIAEFEVESGLHMGRAYEARRGVMLPSLPPQVFALGKGHLEPAVAAGDGAFDRDFAGHSPNITTPAMRASWLREIVGGSSGEVSRHLGRFVQTGLVAVFDGRHYLSELGMKRAANMSRVLPSVIRSRHGAYLGRWYREHEQHHNDGVNRLVVRFAREGVEAVGGWRGEVNVPGLTQVRPDLLVQVSQGPFGEGAYCIEFERRAGQARQVVEKLGPYRRMANIGRPMPLLMVCETGRARQNFAAAAGALPMLTATLEGALAGPLTGAATVWDSNGVPAALHCRRRQATGLAP